MYKKIKYIQSFVYQSSTIFTKKGSTLHDLGRQGFFLLIKIPNPIFRTWKASESPQCNVYNGLKIYTFSDFAISTIYTFSTNTINQFLKNIPFPKYLAEHDQRTVGLIVYKIQLFKVFLIGFGISGHHLAIKQKKLTTPNHAR